MTVGEKIRKIRKQKKMTQNALAELTGLAAITIRQYEANKYIPKIENLRKIAHALETSLTEFLELGEANGRILLLFDSLNANGKKEALKRIEELSLIPAYSSNENN